ncbi:MAG: UTP--glucose-1-phosphate uridylyltransferase GalU [Nitrospirae bacterium]|nr:UTP--glucose-1-phosphate uridylyltransferase GalU [Nitrospirota bacterium]
MKREKSEHPLRKAIIPAAGLGTRFLPATKASPKEMLALVDKPLIQYVVEEAVASGITEIIIVTGRGKRAIEDHFDISFELEENLKSKGKKEALENLRKISNSAKFCYVRQPEALGLGHAILCAAHLIGNEPFAVLLGDDIIDSVKPTLLSMIEIYHRYHAPVIGVHRVPRNQIHQYGVISGALQAKGIYKISDLVEKPTADEAPSDFAIIGRYILTPEILTILEKTKPGKNGEIQLTDGLKAYTRENASYAYEIEGKRHDAGDKLGLLKATVEFGLKNSEFGKAFKEYLKSLKL